MKLWMVALLMLALGANGFQVQVRYLAGSRRTTRRASTSAPHESSLLIRQMLMNNDSFNSSSYSSQHQQSTKHYFQSIKASGEVAKSSDDGSHPTHSSSTGLRMAHGAICPETIAIFEKNSNPAIRRFVDTYHKRGPLACEDLLSDPEVLPHLTKAMRDIHA